jgi:hypothetical protein
MQRQGGGACWRAGGEVVNGPCAPVRGGGLGPSVPEGCVTGQCGLTAMGGGGCGCGTGINPKLFGGRRRRNTRRNRRQTRKNRRCWSRKNRRCWSRKNTRRRR